MTRLFRYWLDLCLLRAAPQDGPASTFTLGFALTCYAMVSVLVMTSGYGMLTGARIALLELALLAAFVTVLLYLLDKAARISQTLAAMAGAGSLLGLVAFPLVLLQGPVTDDGALPLLLSLVWVTLLIWNLAVSAHIMRHALSTSFAIGLAVSVLYLLVSTQIAMTVFPQQAGQ
ncbi:MAG: hypothetical protein WBO34_10500 [Gammaproteobacteria bacterium]